jgi:hypothetical protein
LLPEQQPCIIAIIGYPPGGAGTVGIEMSTSSAMSPFASEPGTVAASSDLGGRPVKPS